MTIYTNNGTAIVMTKEQANFYSDNDYSIKDLGNGLFRFGWQHEWLTTGTEEELLKDIDSNIEALKECGEWED